MQAHVESHWRQSPPSFKWGARVFVGEVLLYPMEVIYELFFP